MDTTPRKQMTAIEHQAFDYLEAYIRELWERKKQSPEMAGEIDSELSMFLKPQAE